MAGIDDGAMAVTVYDGDDSAYLNWMVEHPQGFVLNTKRVEANRFCTIHRSGCAHIRVLRNPEGTGGFTQGGGIKICSDSLDEVLAHVATIKLGPSIKVQRCRSCGSSPADLNIERLAEELPAPSGPGPHALTIQINAFERNPLARALCIRAHGTACKVCEVELERQYGKLGEDAIHVHFLPSLRGLPVDYILDPAKDLIPVCPTCHSMLHRGREEALRIDDLKRIMAQARKRWFEARMSEY